MRAAENSSWAIAQSTAPGWLQDWKATKHEEGNFFYSLALQEWQDLASSDHAVETWLQNLDCHWRLTFNEWIKPWLLLTGGHGHSRRSSQQAGGWQSCGGSDPRSNGVATILRGQLLQWEVCLHRKPVRVQALRQAKSRYFHGKLR